jgi:hypothetical protein
LKFGGGEASKFEKKINNGNMQHITVAIANYNFGVEFARATKAGVDATCKVGRNDINGLAPLDNLDVGQSGSTSRSEALEMGSCGLRFDNKNKKLVRLDDDGGYDLLLSCWPSADPPVCHAEASYEGWPIFYSFPAELLPYNVRLTEAIESLLQRMTVRLVKSRM